MDENIIVQAPLLSWYPTELVIPQVSPSWLQFIFFWFLGGKRDLGFSPNKAILFTVVDNNGREIMADSARSTELGATTESTRITEKSRGTKVYAVMEILTPE